jgi:hypothetical protein
MYSEVTMLCKRKALSWYAAALSVIQCVAVAQAQTSGPLRIGILDIRITGVDCDNLPPQITVVMADKDGKEDRFSIRKIGTCRWKDDTPRTFDASLTHFSLRLIRARTECRMADPYQEPGVGVLNFKCCDAEPVRQVTIRAEMVIKDRSVAVSYLRRVPKGSDGSVACTEHGTFQGTGTIDHVQFHSESLRLQLGDKEPKPTAPGLRVKIPEVKKGRKVNFDVQLDRDDIVGNSTEQRVQADESPPTLSSNAIDIDDKKLKKAGVKTLKLAVQ